jgi:hypothetical protein
MNVFNQISKFSAIPGKFKLKENSTARAHFSDYLGIGKWIGSDQQDGIITQSTQRQVPLNGQAQGKQQEFASPTLRESSSQVSATRRKTNNLNCCVAFRRLIWCFINPKPVEVDIIIQDRQQLVEKLNGVNWDWVAVHSTAGKMTLQFYLKHH